MDHRDSTWNRSDGIEGVGVGEGVMDGRGRV